MRKELEKDYVQNFGKFTRADGSGIYATPTDGEEERLVGAWYLPALVPLVSTIENRADYILIQFAHPGGVIRLDI